MQIISLLVLARMLVYVYACVQHSLSLSFILFHTWKLINKWLSSWCLNNTPKIDVRLLLSFSRPPLPISILLFKHTFIAIYIRAIVGCSIVRSEQNQNWMELQMIMWPLDYFLALVNLRVRCTIDRNYLSKPISKMKLCPNVLGIRNVYFAQRLLFTWIYYTFSDLAKWEMLPPHKIIINGIKIHIICISVIIFFIRSHWKWKIKTMLIEIPLSKIHAKSFFSMFDVNTFINVPQMYCQNWNNLKAFSEFGRSINHFIKERKITNVCCSKSFLLPFTTDVTIVNFFLFFTANDHHA